MSNQARREGAVEALRAAAEALDACGWHGTWLRTRANELEAADVAEGVPICTSCGQPTDMPGCSRNPDDGSSGHTTGGGCADARKMAAMPVVGHAQSAGDEDCDIGTDL